MDRITASLSSLAIASALAGCAAPAENRWASGHTPSFSPLPPPPASSRFEWRKPSVAFYSFDTPAPASSAPSIKDLSDHGQAALIEAMTKAGAKPEDIRDAIARPLAQKAAPTEGAATVEGSYKRTLVATVSRGWDAGPADRLVRTWVEVIPRNFVFDGYTVIATDNQLLNIESVTDTASAGLQAQLGRTTSGTTATTTAQPPVTQVLTDVLGSSAGLSGSLNASRVTNSAVNQQYTKLGADIRPTELRILRESERNLDVSGNTLIALTLRLDAGKWRKDLGSPPVPLQENSQRVTKMRLAKEDGTLVAPKEVVLDVALTKSPPRCPLVADVYLYYELRSVTGNARSYNEGKQRADYVRDVYSETAAEIVPADQVRRPSWRIFAKGGAEITLEDAFGQNLPLDFTSYEQARNFAEWLTRNRGTGKGSGLKIGKAGLRLYSGDDATPLSLGPFQARPHEAAEGAICRWLEISPPPPRASAD